MVKFIDKLLPSEGPLYYLNQHANKVSEAITYLNKAVSDRIFEGKSLKNVRLSSRNLNAKLT